MVAALQRRKLNMFWKREGMLSPRALVKGNPARAKFAAENNGNKVFYIGMTPEWYHYKENS